MKKIITFVVLKTTYMFYRVDIIILLTVISFVLNAAPGPADSLLRRLDTAAGQNKAAIYNKLSKVDSRNNPEKRIDYASKALEFAKKYDNKKEICLALMNLATGYAYLGDNKKALEYDHKALQIAKTLDDKKLLANVYVDLGYDYYFLGDYNNSLKYNLESLKLRTKLYNDGILKSEKSIAMSMNNIGSIYNILNKPAKAIEYHRKSMQIRERMGDSTGIGRSLHNIGSVYERLNDNEKALDYYRRALKIREALGNKRHIAETLNNMGNTLKSLKRYDSAIICYKKAYQIFDKIQDNGRKVVAMNNLGGIYIRIKEPAKAFPLLMKGIELAKATGQKKVLDDIYENLTGYYILKNDYKNAFETQKLRMELEDTIFNENLAEKISEMQVKYESEKKEQEIELLTKNSEIQALKLKRRNIQLIIAVVFFVLITLVIILAFNRRRLKQKHLQAEMEKKNIEMEQRLIRSQMNPHFIFNSLNSIQSYISNNDGFRAMTYLSKFGMLMRYILENSRKPLITVSDEIKTLETYIQLEKARFKDIFDYKITVSPEINTESFYIPPMLIQPFVENAIKHGFKNIPDKGLLEINFFLNEKVIKCTVRDNGIGRKKAGEAKASHRSLGMEITRERLSALGKLTRLDIKFEIIDLTGNNGLPAGTEVTLFLPFEKD